jgi:hypothetical protein
VHKVRQVCIAAAAVVVSLAVAQPVFAVGAVPGVKISQVSIMGASTLALTFSGPIFGKPACHTNSASVMLIDVTTNKGRAVLSLATSALLANVTITALGLGTCSSVPGTTTAAENLDSIIVTNQ